VCVGFRSVLVPSPKFQFQWGSSGNGSVESVKWTVNGASPEFTSTLKFTPPSDTTKFEVILTKINRRIKIVNDVVAICLSCFPDMIPLTSNEYPLYR
jgi:hypothetical protein